jgi:hypothetical protein
MLVQQEIQYMQLYQDTDWRYAPEKYTISNTILSNHLINNTIGLAAEVFSEEFRYIM